MTSLTSKIDTHDKDIKSDITTSQNTITNAINGVKNDITEQGTTLKNVINTKGCVKSVQRGYVDGINMNEYEKGTFEIPISDINPDKSIILINYHNDYNIERLLNPSITKNKLLIPYDNSSNTVDEKTGKCDYQIMEFY